MFICIETRNFRDNRQDECLVIELDLETAIHFRNYLSKKIEDLKYNF